MSVPKSSSQNSVTFVNLEGGIGNQLFQYVAGLYVSRNIGTDLVLNISRVLGNRHSGHCITNFDLPGVSRVDFVSNTPKIDNRLVRSFRYRNKFGNINLKVYFEKPQQLEATVLQMKGNRGLSGYFQTSRYLDLLVNHQVSLNDLSLLNPSIEYLTMVAELKKTSPIIVHVRRGDYLSHQHRFGILSKKYYESAVASLKSENQEKEIWLFSDDFPRVKLEFRDIDFGSKIRYMEETSTMVPAEVMKLMSLGSAKVIANSTFSWWSAYLNQPGTEVIVPTPWFRQLDSDTSLLLPYWINCPAQWD
jgi:hypothetical protein